MDPGYVNIDKMPKFCAAYLETPGDESIFADPFFGSATDNDSVTGTNINISTLLDHRDGFVLKHKKLI